MKLGLQMPCEYYIARFSQEMLNHIDIVSWHPKKVKDWLLGVLDDCDWLKSDFIINENVDGRKLLLMDAHVLERLGANKVNTQERILEAIEELRNFHSNMNNETLQILILRLACQARELQFQLVTENAKHNLEVIHQKDLITRRNSIPLLSEYKLDNKIINVRQRVSLDTLASVSKIVTTVKQTTNMCNCFPFSKYDDYRSIKSLLLALSIELTSTAQRDQFVENPNDIIEKSAKALADYCDRIVHATIDPLLIQPFYLDTVRIKKSASDNSLGLSIGSHPTEFSKHFIENIAPFSAAKKTNKLNEGDEVILFNQYIVGWSSKNVEKLLENTAQQREVVLIVKKRPFE